MKTQIFIPQTQADLAAVLAYVAQRVDDFDPKYAQGVIASVKDGRLIGAVVYHNCRGTDVEMVAAGEPGWLNRETLKVYFAYPFEQLGCRRVTAVCHRKNKHARKFVERLGFRLEGVHRDAMEDGADAISYGLLKSDCRWVNLEQHAPNADLSERPSQYELTR